MLNLWLFQYLVCGEMMVDLGFSQWLLLNFSVVQWLMWMLLLQWWKMMNWLLILCFSRQVFLLLILGGVMIWGVCQCQCCVRKFFIGSWEQVMCGVQLLKVVQNRQIMLFSIVSCGFLQLELFGCSFCLKGLVGVQIGVDRCLLMWMLLWLMVQFSVEVLFIDMVWQSRCMWLLSCMVVGLKQVKVFYCSFVCGFRMGLLLKCWKFWCIQLFWMKVLWMGCVSGVISFLRLQCVVQQCVLVVLQQMIRFLLVMMVLFGKMMCFMQFLCLYLVFVCISGLVLWLSMRCGLFGLSRVVLMVKWWLLEKQLWMQECISSQFLVMCMGGVFIFIWLVGLCSSGMM